MTPNITGERASRRLTAGLRILTLVEVTTEIVERELGIERKQTSLSEKNGGIHTHATRREGVLQREAFPR